MRGSIKRCPGGPWRRLASSRLSVGVKPSGTTCKAPGGNCKAVVDLSKQKICFLAGTLGQGGAERQLFYILRALSESGAEVRLLSLTQGEFWQEKIEALGVKVIWVGQS